MVPRVFVSLALRRPIIFMTTRRLNTVMKGDADNRDFISSTFLAANKMPKKLCREKPTSKDTARAIIFLY